MKKEPDISKLPLWAQKYISDLKRQRETAVRFLNESLDRQTESPFYVESYESTEETTGPSLKYVYFQTHRMQVHHAGVYLSITLRDKSVDLTWGNRRFGLGNVAFVPTSYQAASLVNKDNMGD